MLIAVHRTTIISKPGDQNHPKYFISTELSTEIHNVKEANQEYKIEYEK